VCSLWWWLILEFHALGVALGPLGCSNCLFALMLLFGNMAADFLSMLRSFGFRWVCEVQELPGNLCCLYR
jgi:hypothetical protein